MWTTDVRSLRPGQLDVLRQAVAGQPVFVHGPPNAGKTHVLRHVIDVLRATGRALTLVGGTPEAATQLGGVRFSRLLGFAKADDILSEARRNLRPLHQFVSSTTVELVRSTDVLVVDDVSAVSAAQLDALDMLARQVRPDGTNKPLGGMHVLFAGYGDGEADTTPAFVETPAMRAAVWPLLHLADVDLGGVDAGAPQLRVEHDADDRRERLRAAASWTRLVGDEAEARAVNADNVRALSTTTGVDIETFRPTERIARAHHDGATAEHPCDADLQLCVGARVVLVQALPSVRAGRVGHVTKIDSKAVVVNFHAGADAADEPAVPAAVVKPVTFLTEARTNMPPVARRTAMPLLLAYAITPQRMRLFAHFGAACVWVPPGRFAPGMAYIVRSRLRSRSQLLLLDRAPEAYFDPPSPPRHGNRAVQDARGAAAGVRQGVRQD